MEQTVAAQRRLPVVAPRLCQPAIPRCPVSRKRGKTSRRSRRRPRGSPRRRQRPDEHAVEADVQALADACRARCRRRPTRKPSEERDAPTRGGRARSRSRTTTSPPRKRSSPPRSRTRPSPRRQAESASRRAPCSTPKRRKPPRRPRSWSGCARRRGARSRCARRASSATTSSAVAADERGRIDGRRAAQEPGRGARVRGRQAGHAAAPAPAHARRATQRLEQALAELAEDYADRGIALQSVSGGYQFRTNTQYSAWVQQLIAGRPVRLSRAQLETLAIVAYRQPITRPEIDEIRGVDSSATLQACCSIAR